MCFSWDLHRGLCYDLNMQSFNKLPSGHRSLNKFDGREVVCCRCAGYFLDLHGPAFQNPPLGYTLEHFCTLYCFRCWFQFPCAVPAMLVCGTDDSGQQDVMSQKFRCAHYDRYEETSAYLYPVGCWQYPRWAACSFLLRQSPRNSLRKTNASLFPHTEAYDVSTILRQNNNKLSFSIHELIDFMSRLAVTLLDWRPLS